MILFFMTMAITMTITFLSSLFEACLLSISLSDIALIQEKHPLAARIWLGFKKNIDRPIAVILIINTLSYTIGASLLGSMFDLLFAREYILVFSLIYAVAMIQWTEILPKTLGVKYNKSLAKISAVPLKVLINIFAPFVVVIHAINRLFSGKRKTEEKLDIVGEISVLAHFAHSNEQISKDQERILSQALKLSKLTLKEILVKKADIKFLSTNMSLANALIEAHLHHHTRFPLIQGENTDDVIGYVNFKDIVTALRVNPSDPSLKGIARPIISLKEDETISTALSKLTSAYQHIALVKDKTDRLTGIVTLENILETIIGDLYDEYDILPAHFYKLSETRMLAGGGVKIKEVDSTLNLKLTDKEGTLNDWLLQLFGKIPATDDHFKFQDYDFTIRKVSRSKIYEASIDRMEKK
jgi:CBS domain containing-hemolysin-like protein